MDTFLSSSNGYGAIRAASVALASATPHHVNLQLSPAVAYWCRHFKTTPERLFDAVKRVGTNPSIVRKLLLEKQPA